MLSRIVWTTSLVQAKKLGEKRPEVNREGTVNKFVRIIENTGLKYVEMEYIIKFEFAFFILNAHIT